MSWGMSFKAYLYRVHPDGVEDKIQENEDFITYLKGEINRACSPCPFVCDNMDSLLEDLCDAAGELRMLYQAKNGEDVEVD